jgi:hypothetical protein
MNPTGSLAGTGVENSNILKIQHLANAVLDLLMVEITLVETRVLVIAAGFSATGVLDTWDVTKQA